MPRKLIFSICVVLFFYLSSVRIAAQQSGSPATTTANASTAQAHADDLVRSLMALQTDEQRAAELEKIKDKLTVELQQALAKEADRLRMKGDFQQSLSAFELARLVAERRGDRSGVAEVLRLIGNAYSGKYDYARAVEFYEKSFAESEAAGDRYIAARALNNIGIVHFSQNRYAQALDFYKRALAMGESVGNLSMTAMWVNNIGNAYRAQADYPRALEYFQKSLAISESVNAKAGIALTNSNIGLVRNALGDYAGALEHYNKALALFEELKDQGNASRMLVNIGSAHWRQNDVSLALSFYEKGLAASEQSGNKYMTIEALRGIAYISEQRGDLVRALELFQKSLLLTEIVKDKEQAAFVLRGIGCIYFREGKYEAALENYQRSLALLESINDERCAAWIRQDMADAYSSLGRHAEALSSAEQATETARRLALPDVLWRTRTTTGLVHRALKRTVEARQAFDEAIAVIEALRANVAGTEHAKQQFFEDKLTPYRQMVEMLVEQNKTGEAFVYAERAKARALVEVLQGGRGKIEQAATSRETTRERELEAALVTLNAQISYEGGLQTPDNKRLAELEDKRRAARLEYEAFQTDLYAAHPELRARRGASTPVSLSQIAELLPAAKGALLEYVLTDSGVYLFVLTKADARRLAPVDLRAYRLNVNAKELGVRAENFRRQIAARKPFEQSARSLYDALLRPAAAQLRGQTTLVIVPDGPLWNLPFQALQSATGRFLIEDHAVSYAPSLTALREMKKSHRGSEQKSSDSVLLAFGNPMLSEQQTARAGEVLRADKLEPLPEAEREVEALRALYGTERSRVYTGAEASEARFKQEAGRFRVLQIATHGVIDDASPLYSHLVLSQTGAEGREDGLLEAWEMMNLKLNADMVVLSACETARGRTTAGEGLIGMSWALFVGGSPATVASQWKVSSKSTSELMLDFHRELNRTRGRSSAKALALQSAALKMMSAGGAYRHPFYWAAFTVIGDAD